jgi:hypothetical protein
MRSGLAGYFTSAIIATVLVAIVVGRLLAPAMAQPNETPEVAIRAGGQAPLQRNAL